MSESSSTIVATHRQKHLRPFDEGKVGKQSQARRCIPTIGPSQRGILHEATATVTGQVLLALHPGRVPWTEAPHKQPSWSSFPSRNAERDQRIDKTERAADTAAFLSKFSAAIEIVLSTFGL
jgi:hypothetical protein